MRREPAAARADRGERLQPPRSAEHHGLAEGGFHRLLHVQLVRGRPQRVRHADCELPAAAGSVRRPELLRARSGGPVRDPRRQRRRRGGRPDVPVPFQEPPRRQQHRQEADDRRPERRRAAEEHRPDQRAGRLQSQLQRELHAEAGARRSPHRPVLAGDSRGRRRDRVRQAVRFRRHQDLRQHRRLRAVREDLHP